MATVEEFNLNSLIESYSWTLVGSQEGDVKNGHVLFLLVGDNFSLLNVTKKLFDYFNYAFEKPLTVNNIRMRCRRLVENYKSLKKHIINNWGSRRKLLNESFLAVKRVLIKRKENVPVVLELPSCCHRDLDRESFLKSISDLKVKLRIAKRAINELKKNKILTKRTNQTLKRKEATTMNYKNQKSILRAQIVLLQKDNANLKAQEERHLKKRKALKKEVVSLRKSQAKKASLIVKAKEDIGHLTEQLLNSSGFNASFAEDEGEGKQQNAYDAHSRKCVFTCLESNVPVEKAEHLVKFILKELSNNSLTWFPAPNTIAQMAYEMGVISDLQIAEHLYFSTVPVATIGWDATSIEGFHFNEINISIDGRTFTLEIGKLAGGTTLDYTRHLLGSVDSLATLYSAFAKLEQKVVLEKFHSLFHSTLSDRAPVNNCVSTGLSEVLSKTLVKLNCSVHPLDGLATEAKKVLKGFDDSCSTRSELFGGDARAANLILSVGKLRYKMNSGDPADFKTFLRLSDISTGTVPRYVGNRLHILFHSAGVLVLLKDFLHKFLEQYCKDNTLRAPILKELQQPVIFTQLRLLGLFGKLLTGPWMTVFYKNEDKKTHVDMVPVLKTCLENLTIIATQPRILLDASTDCFGNALDNEDDVLIALRVGEADVFFEEVGKSLAEGFHRVLERQLSSYLKGELSITTPELVFKTSSAPLHNMHSERALGMFDAQCSRAKNATAGFVDGKVKYKLNNASFWLVSKTLGEQKVIISFAISHGASKRKSLSEREKSIQQAAALRQKQMSQKRDKQKRKALEKTIEGDRLLASFEDLEPEIRTPCLSLLASASSFVGKTHFHTWEGDDGDGVYTGTVTKVSSKAI